MTDPRYIAVPVEGGYWIKDTKTDAPVIRLCGVAVYRTVEGASRRAVAMSRAYEEATKQ